MHTQTTLAQKDLIAEPFSKKRRGTNTQSTISIVLLLLKAAKKFLSQCYLILLVSSICMRKEQRFSFSQKLKSKEEDEKKISIPTAVPFLGKKK